MSAYNPPREILPTFNPTDWQYGTDITLTQADADLRYLRLIGGTERGDVNFNQDIQVDGTFTGTSVYASDINYTSTLAGPTGIFTSIKSTNNDLTNIKCTSLTGTSIYGTNIQTSSSLTGTNLYGSNLYSTHIVSGPTGTFTSLSANNAVISETLSVSGNVAIDTDVLFIDTSTNRVGINKSAPLTYALDVQGGSLNVDGAYGYRCGNNYVLNSTTLFPNVTISSLTSVGTLTSLVVSGNVAVDTNVLYVDTTNNRVGIVNSSPGYPLSVVGDCNLSSGSAYRINNNTVLNTTTLAGSVLNSSLTSVGVLSSLSVSGNISNQACIRTDTANSWTSIGGNSPTCRLDCDDGLKVGKRDSGDTNYHISSRWAYDRTTASASNMYISASSGDPEYAIRRSTSSVKYKTQVENIFDEFSSKIYDLRPVYYKSLCQGDNPDWSHWGLIAEEVAEVDPRLVHFDGDEPEGVQYTRVLVLVLKELQKLKKRFDDLESKLT